MSRFQAAGICFRPSTYNTSPATHQTYSYGNASFPAALTGITDENGHSYASWTYDSSGRMATSQLAGGVNFTSVSYFDDTATAMSPARSASSKPINSRRCRACRRSRKSTAPQTAQCRSRRAASLTTRTVSRRAPPTGTATRPGSPTTATACRPRLSLPPARPSATRPASPMTRHGPGWRTSSRRPA